MQKKHIFLTLLVIALAVGGYYAYTYWALGNDSMGGPNGGANAKINVEEVCRGALAYMSFPDAAAAEAFVQACINGERPEVIEKYKQDMGLGDGAAI